MKNNNDTPILKESHDHIYPRCVWCNGEIHGPAVIDYSKGLQECGAVNGCGKGVPEDWRLKDE